MSPAESKEMRVAVLGSGGVGAYFGGRLALAGRDVSFVARARHLEVMRERGLRVDSALGDFVLPDVVATDRTDQIGPVDLVMVCVKAWQVAEVAGDIPPLLAPTTAVMTTQNGVEAADLLIERLGPTPVMVGIVRIVSFLVGPGHVRHAGFDPQLVVGALDPAAAARLELLFPVLDVPGFHCERADDIRVQQWIKFVFVCGWAAVAVLTGEPVGTLRDSPVNRRLIERSMGEVERVGRARGIDLPDAVARGMADIDALPPASTVSLQRDLDAGIPSELDSFSGAVVRLGQSAGVDTPIHRMAYAAMLPRETRARAARTSGESR